MKVPEQFRLNTGIKGDNNGIFLIPNGKGRVLLVLSRELPNTDKLKITTAGRKPTWQELLKIIQLFWKDEEGNFTISYRGTMAGVIFDKLNIYKEPFFDDYTGMINTFDEGDETLDPVR